MLLVSERSDETLSEVYKFELVWYMYVCIHVIVINRSEVYSRVLRFITII